MPARGGSATAGLDGEINQIFVKAQAEGLGLTGKEGLLGGLIKKALESAMNAEMTAHLGYEKYAPEGHGTGNSRNGTTTATVHTNVGQVEIDRPRDRNGAFNSVVLPKGTRRLGEFDDMVFSWFAKGVTTRDIAEHIEITYDAKVSHETIANITDGDQRHCQGMAQQGPGRGLSDRLHRRDPAPDPRRRPGADQGLPLGRGRRHGRPQTGSGRVDRADRRREILGPGAHRAAQP